MARIDLRDGISDELNAPIKARWALRTFIVGLVLGAFIWGGLIAKDTVAELSERQAIEAHLIENHSILRGFENNAYGTYWRHCGLWVTAAHVHKETMGATPAPVDRNPHVGFEIDAAFYGDEWTCGAPTDLQEGQGVWIAGFPGGANSLAMRRGEVYLKRSASGSDGYSEPTWIVVFPKNNIAAWLSEPVAGGMSGGIVIDAESLEPMGILVTQNSQAVLQAFGPDAVHSSDVVSLHDAYNVLIK